MVIPNAAQSAIPKVIFTEEVLFVDVPLGAIRGRNTDPLTVGLDLLGIFGP